MTWIFYTRQLCEHVVCTNCQPSKCSTYVSHEHRHLFNKERIKLWITKSRCLTDENIHETHQEQLSNKEMFCAHCNCDQQVHCIWGFPVHVNSTADICPIKWKMQYLHFRFHTNYFLLPWKIPEQISRRSMHFHN